MKITHSTKTWAALILGITFAISSLKAADSAASEKTGLKVGQKAPNWTLTDQTGTQHTLKSLTDKGPVALVFYRSANW